MLLMLEDNTERIARFHATLRLIAPELPLRVWRDAHTMVAGDSPVQRVGSFGNSRIYVAVPDVGDIYFGASARDSNSPHTAGAA